MAKKIPEGVDSKSILNSIRPETPPLEQTPPTPTVERVETATQVEDTAPTAAAPKRKSSPRKKRGDEQSDYERCYLHNVDITVRSCKLVNVRAEYHERINKIIRVIGKNDLSLFEYIDNVLTEHFDKYEEEITRLYNQNHEGVF